MHKFEIAFNLLVDIEKVLVDFIQVFAMIFNIFGLYIICSKKVKYPRYRITGYSCYIVGDIFFIIYGFMIASFSIIIMNIIYVGVNIAGIINAKIEIKHDKKNFISDGK